MPLLPPKSLDLPEQLISNHPDILVFVDQHGVVTELHTRDSQLDLARALFRPGEPVFRLLPPESASALADCFQQLDSPQDLRVVEFQAKIGNVKTSFEARVMSVARDSRCLIVRDISTWKATESALRTASSAAQAASRSKSTFLANMSHEIRTPMNGILGMVQLLETTLVTDEQKEFAATIRSCADHLLAILHDILDLSKIEAGRVNLEPREFGLSEELAATVGLYRALCQEKGILLSCNIHADLPVRAVGANDRLWQVLNNLLGNAIKFTRDGEIKVSASVTEVTESDFTLRIEIVDTGIGIPEDRLERIFEPFTQADSSTTRRFGGTGLGLTICKQILIAMGGNISVSSSEGEGSTFRFHVPLLQSSQFIPAPTRPRLIPIRRAHPNRGDRSQRRVLLAEDNAVNRTVVTRMLERLGFEVVTAENGVELIQILLQDADFDGILMDVQMPELDGIETTLRIRKQRKFDFLPIVALTAHAMRGDEERCLEAGMTDYLSKPIRANELARVCELIFLSPRTNPEHKQQT
jgi:signal transduction histidine kinase/CheY-like chemotaxis protein